MYEDGGHRDPARMREKLSHNAISKLSANEMYNCGKCCSYVSNRRI